MDRYCSAFFVSCFFDFFSILSVPFCGVGKPSVLSSHVLSYLGTFGRCTGITFVGSMMIPVCHNLRRYANKVFKVSPPMGKELWSGVTASNCILRAMTEARL